MTVAQEVVVALGERGWTVATCESLTGGMVISALVEPAGASAVVRGGLVTYASDLKTELAGVPAELIAAHGVVSAPVVLEMATGARLRCGADVGVATTGVAGPDPLEGAAVGTVWLAVVTPQTTQARRLRLSGDRATIRQGAAAAAVDLLLRALAGDVGGDASGTCGADPSTAG